MGLSTTTRIIPGDPVPWFRVSTISGGRIDLHVSAGRWIVLAFLDALSEAHTQKRIAALVQHASACSDDHLVIYAVLPAPPDDLDQLQALSNPVLKFIADYDGAIAKDYHAHQSPRTVVLDPMLRCVANISCELLGDHDRILSRFLLDLPSVGNSAGVPLTAPVLLVPRIFDASLCEQLISVFDMMGGTDSGFLVDRDGAPVTITDHKRKQRLDLVIVDRRLCETIREVIVKRLLPAVELYFQFKATHMDRYVVACYDNETGGHFFRHRDNMSPGVEHRRFAVSLNLNSDYEGCDLIFPEFGRRTYRAPVGGALVFSCGALHEVTPITKGRRYAFLPFLYGQSDVEKSVENDARLREIGLDYRVDQHNLYAETRK
jgi:predicted 2-oxoglutarate/Fe(II)-dependent dioxygenase YbiX/peroxiredoxin